MPEPTIPPALSFEEWKECYDSLQTFPKLDRVHHAVSLVNGLRPAKPSHALAALCLHGQSFGFSQAELEQLSHAIDDAERWIANNPYGGHTGAVEASRIVLAKLRALLPPPEDAR